MQAVLAGFGGQRRRPLPSTTLSTPELRSWPNDGRIIHIINRKAAGRLSCDIMTTACRLTPPRKVVWTAPEHIDGSSGECTLLDEPLLEQPRSPSNFPPPALLRDSFGRSRQQVCEPEAVPKYVGACAYADRLREHWPSSAKGVELAALTAWVNCAW